MPGAGQDDEQDALLLVEGVAGAVPLVGQVAFLETAGDDPVELLSLAGVGVEEVDPGADRALVVALAEPGQGGSRGRARGGLGELGDGVADLLDGVHVAWVKGGDHLGTRVVQSGSRWHAGDDAADQVEDGRVLHGQVPVPARY